MLETIARIRSILLSLWSMAMIFREPASTDTTSAPAWADEDGSWTTISYLRHIFDQFDVRSRLHAINNRNRTASPLAFSACTRAYVDPFAAAFCHRSHQVQHTSSPPFLDDAGEWQRNPRQRGAHSGTHQARVQDTALRAGQQWRWHHRLERIRNLLPLGLSRYPKPPQGKNR